MTISNASATAASSSQIDVYWETTEAGSSLDQSTTGAWGGEQTSVYDGSVSNGVGALPVTGLSAGTHYYFRISDDTGSSYTYVDASTSGGENTPPTLNASSGAYTDKVALTWAAVTNADSYKVYRNSTNSTSGATLLSGLVETNSYNDTSAPIGVLLFYFAKTTIGGSDSAAGDIAQGFRALDPTYVPSPANVATGVNCINTDLNGYTTGTHSGGGGGIDVGDIVDAKYVLTGHDNYVDGDHGTLTLPAVSDVWNTADDYGVVGALETPSINGMVASDITNCTAVNVKDGVSIGDVTGSYDPMADAVWPNASSVLVSVGSSWGPTGTEYSGGYVAVPESKVKDGELYGLAGAQEGTYDPITGNYTNPTAALVAKDVEYKFAGSTVTGTFDPQASDYSDPGPANVAAGVQYLNAGQTKVGTKSMTLIF